METDSELLKVRVPCLHLCPMPTTGPISRGREGKEGGRSVNDEFGSEHVEFEMTADVQKVLEMQY